MRILWVEQDVIAVQFMRTAMENAGYVIDKVETIEEAQQRAAEARETGNWPYGLLLLGDVPPGSSIGWLKGEFTTVDLHKRVRDDWGLSLKVMFLTNRPYKVPDHLQRGEYTQCYDKFEMCRHDGRLVKLIQRFAGPAIPEATAMAEPVADMR